MTQTILTGIKPTGTPHLGNYFGAIEPALRLADEPGWRAVYFVADYHALTSIHDGEELRRSTLEVAATWLACGLDPERMLFYRHSDVPEIFELTWVLACFTAKGLLNRAHAYKAKVADNTEAGLDPDDGVDAGLFNYPVLMAADIILFDTDVVPVGADQQQHLEIARDVAQRFNARYGDVLTVPEARIAEGTAVLPGIDGRKMSKSYGNAIPLFAPPKQRRKLVMRIVTDSTPPEAPKDPETSTIFQLYKAVAPPADVAALEARYHEGIGWGDAKAALDDALEARFGAARERYDELLAKPEVVYEALAAGAEQARAVGRQRLDAVRAAIGIGLG